MAEKAKKKWMKGVVEHMHKGKFSAKAEAVGKSTSEYAHEHEHDSGTLGKEARLAEVFQKAAHHRHKKAHSAMASHKEIRKSMYGKE